MRVRSAYARVLDHRVRSLEAGSGAALLLLPSPLIMAATYRPLIRRLAAGFRVLALELPGSGFSSEPRRPLTTDEHADVALRFLALRGFDRAVWVGHSNSGPVAVAAALVAPERVERLVLFDSVGGRPGDSLLRLLAARLLDGLFEVRVSLRGLPHLVWNVVRHRRSFAAQVRLAQSADIGPALERLRVPALLAWGARDRTQPRAFAVALARRAPDVELAFGNGRHDWLIDHAAEAARLIDKAARPRDS
jgi:(E)-2-((N-methylformamido)methylene)succinate hydrolase